MVLTPSASACSRRSPAPGARLSHWLLSHWLLSIGLGGAAVLGSSSLGCAHTATQRAAPTSTLEISCETRDADVWVDGQYIGQIDQVSGKLGLTPGVHRVEIRKPGHFPVQRTVRVDKRAGGIVRLSAEMLQDPR